MKTFLMATAALALIAAPAAAQDWQGQTYGQDAAAWWLLNANVDDFCRLNAGGGVVSSAVNATFTHGANGQGGTSQEADGTVNLDIQNNNDNTVQHSGLAVTYGKSQCNTPFTVYADSLNGGLDAQNTTTDTDFTQLVNYQVDVVFDTFSSGGVMASTLVTETALGSHPQAQAGDFRIGIVVFAQDDLLLEGTYSDFLKITMKPTV